VEYPWMSSKEETMALWLSTLALALAAGVCSGGWPIAFKLSGLNGAYMPLVFVVGGAVASIPVAMVAFNIVKVPLGDVQWGLLGLAAALGGGVLLLLATMLGVTQSNQIGTFLMIWSITQVSVAAAYTVTMNGLNTRFIVGFIAAVVAVVALANH